MKRLQKSGLSYFWQQERGSHRESTQGSGNSMLWARWWLYWGFLKHFILKMLLACGLFRLLKIFVQMYAAYERMHYVSIMCGGQVRVFKAPSIRLQYLCVKYSYPMLLSNTEFISFILLYVCTLQPASLHLCPPHCSPFPVSVSIFPLSIYMCFLKKTEVEHFYVFFHASLHISVFLFFKNPKNSFTKLQGTMSL